MEQLLAEFKKNAKLHWGYIESLLEKHYPDEDTICLMKEDFFNIIGFHYRTAMEHGYKHALQDMGYDEEEDAKIPDWQKNLIPKLKTGEDVSAEEMNNIHSPIKGPPFKWDEVTINSIKSNI